MSRIGKAPIPLPKGVEVNLTPGLVKVKGPKGHVEQVVPHEIKIECDASEVKVTDPKDGRQKRLRAMHGLTRALVANAVHGCSIGFEKTLEIIGVGYRAQMQGRALKLQIGFCHPVEMPLPQGIEIELPSQTKIIIRGADKQVVGQFAAKVRGVRPPEPYKGKGIRYEGEEVKLKAGKKFAGGD